MTRPGRDARVTALLLAPAGLFLGAWFLLPLAQLFRLSLGGREGPLQAYREVLGSVVYQRVFLNTLVVAFVVTVVCLLLAYPTAFVLARLRGGLRAVAFYCVLVPFWISLLVRTYAWMLLLGTQGPINATLVNLGLVSQPLPLLFNSTGVLIGMVHVLLPYAILPIYAAMVKVDARLLLASDGLGAPPATTFRRVYLPLTLPGVTAGAVFVFLLGLGFFVTPALLGGLGNLMINEAIAEEAQTRLLPIGVYAPLNLKALAKATPAQRVEMATHPDNVKDMLILDEEAGAQLTWNPKYEEMWNKFQLS